MTQLIAACVRLGISKGTRNEAWIVAQDASRGETVAERPVLDMLLDSGAEIVRPATPAERLTGEASGAARPAGVAWPPP